MNELVNQPKYEWVLMYPVYFRFQEEDMKTREALMQQSRREAKLSRQRLEEERQRSKQKKESVSLTVWSKILSHQTIKTKTKYGFM